MLDINYDIKLNNDLESNHSNNAQSKNILGDFANDSNQGEEEEVLVDQFDMLGIELTEIKKKKMKKSKLEAVKSSMFISNNSGPTASKYFKMLSETENGAQSKQKAC